MNQYSALEEEAKRQAKIDEPNPKPQEHSTALKLGFALLLILVLAVAAPLWDAWSFRTWLPKAQKEAEMLFPLLREKQFDGIGYSAQGDEVILYQYEFIEEQFSLIRAERERIPLPEGAAKTIGAFEDARSVQGGVLFARHIKVLRGGDEWDGLFFAGEDGLGALEEYVLREDDGIPYLAGVPEAIK